MSRDFMLVCVGVNFMNILVSLVMGNAPAAGISAACGAYCAFVAYYRRKK